MDDGVWFLLGVFVLLVIPGFLIVFFRSDSIPEKLPVQTIETGQPVIISTPIRPMEQIVEVRAEPKPIRHPPARPLLSTQVDSESGRMTIELSDGMKAVFVVALIVCCLVLIAGYWTAVRLIKKEQII